MTDITEKLRKYAVNQHGWIDIDDTCEAAADEIDRLRNLVDQCDHHEHSLQDAQARIAELETQNEHLCEEITLLQTLNEMANEEIDRLESGENDD